MQFFKKNYSSKIYNLLNDSFVTYFNQNELDYKNFFIDYKHIFEIILFDGKQISFDKLTTELTNILRISNTIIPNFHLLSDAPLYIYKKNKSPINILESVKIFQKILPLTITKDIKKSEQIYLILKKEFLKKSYSKPITTNIIEKSNKEINLSIFTQITY